ncbi:MAG: isoprenyl transferase [Candidatus Aminicenantes bacterium]|nr:isoprenyl transferase [Candidatus Aminicenantes bacterium]
MLKGLEGWLADGSEEARLAARLIADRMPRHVAVIMDGNGRWAGERGLPRTEGHKAAAASVREIVETGARLGLEVLSLFAFSTENWKRPAGEIRMLMNLLEDFLGKEACLLVENDLRLRVLGDKEKLPGSLRKALERVEQDTRKNTRMTVGLALNYGGRADIVAAVRRILAEGLIKPRDLDEASFARHLDTAGLPDPDLLIRTSGESRISNFFLWQIAYAEIWITKTYWPDFRKIHLFQALLDYQGRERRFGEAKV